jgi:hypothetical protein
MSLGLSIGEKHNKFGETSSFPGRGVRARDINLNIIALEVVISTLGDHI